MRVSKDVVADLMRALLEAAPPLDSDRGRLAQLHFRLGLCRALDIVGTPVPEVENSILREIAAGARARAGQAPGA